MKTGFVVFAHGSSVESANEAVRAVVRDVARRGGLELVEAAFLEGGTPGLEGAVERLVGSGAGRIVVLPYFLTLGLHLQRDLPRIVDALSRKYAGVEIRVTAPLDGHPALAAVLLERAREAT
ncbi:MAG: sirohydrochlorin chelatase [Bryobacteraceae bacterium]